VSIEPHASAKRVFWVVANGSSHNGQASISPLTARRELPRAIQSSTANFRFP